MYYLLKTCSIAVFSLFLLSFQSNELGWNEYFQNDQVKIEVKTDACNNIKDGINNNYVFVRISNKTAVDLKVSFSKELWYNETCTSCNGGDEFKTMITLKANETLEGTCDSKTKDLKIFHSMANGSKKVLTKFDLKNLTIQELK